MAEGPRDGKLMDKLRGDLDSGDMTLDERLQQLGMDPNEYKAYGSDYTCRCNRDRS
jgi:small subunit ribosomal protein S10